MVFFLAQPILAKRPAVELALSIAGLLAFLVLYFAGFWLRDRRIIWCAVGILLLGVLFVPSNAGASCFFIYAAAFFGSVHPPRLAMSLIGAVTVMLLVMVRIGEKRWRAAGLDINDDNPITYGETR